MHGEVIRVVHDSGKSKHSEISSNRSGIINDGGDEQMEVFGYVRSTVRTVAVWIGSIVSLGLFRLALHWWPSLHLHLTHRRCPLDSADTVLVVEKFQGKYTSYHVEDVKVLLAKDIALTDFGSKKDDEKINNHYEYRTMKCAGSVEFDVNLKLRVHLNNNTYRDVDMIKGIQVKKLFYVWDQASFSFIRLSGLEQGFGAADFHSSSGLSQREQKLRQGVYGYNEIVVPRQSIVNMVVMEMLNPFYFFQAFSLLLWFIEGYIYYPIAIIIMSTFGISSYVIQTRKSQRLLYETVQSTGSTTVCRGEGKYENVPVNQLVPGDVILIPEQGCQMYCDAMLLNGSCIVNESMLTGESVPVSKSSLPRYHSSNCTPHTLHCGTTVLQARSPNPDRVTAVVLRTGFLTTKGNLVRSILYPPPADFKFETDSYKFIGILSVIAVLGLIYTAVSKYSRGIAFLDLIIKALDLLTICIPPALPAAMTVGKIFAQHRLERARIYCINSRVINVSGALDCMCFDKTGTLTEDGLDFHCAVPVTDGSFTRPHNHPLRGTKGPLVKAMAVCHSLTNIDRKLAGDPLDMKMFESTGWTIEEPSTELRSNRFDPHVNFLVREVPFLPDEGEEKIGNQNNTNGGSEVKTEIALFHQFAFESSLQRMSIVTKEVGSDEFVLYCKGSPEMIMAHSKQETIPQNTLDILQAYTEKGYRVIGLGRKRLPETNYEDIQRLSRSDIEIDVDFLGIIVMENRLKPQTAPVIEILKNADFKIVMITGDNIETAVSVARECGIVGKTERIINVTAVPPTNNESAQITYRMVATSRETSQLVIKENGAVPSNDDSKLDVQYRFALSGTSWKVIRESFPDILPRLVTRGVVFARMSSEQKQQLILQLKDVGYIVGMCGDGANDCGALKAANVGISLSEAESSVASPFTSKEDNIECVSLVIKEGRAALITAFGIFKFMVLYSLVEFLSVFILYGIDSNLTDIEFLFIDIFLVLQFALSFGKTEAFLGALVRDTPIYTLMSTEPLLSIGLQVVVMFSVQIAAYHIVQVYPWFEPFKYSVDSDIYSCYENYAVFGSSMGQYLIMTIVFSKGEPYRKPIYTNFVLSGSLLVMGAIITYIAIDPAEWVQNVLELTMPPTYGFRLVIVGFWIINLVISYVVEDLFVTYFMAKKVLPKWNNTPQKKHEIVELEMLSDTNWPLAGHNPTTNQAGV